MFRRINCICSVVIVTIVLPIGQVSAQVPSQGKYITEATSRLTKLIDQSNAQGYTLGNDVFSIGGGWLKQGNDNWVALYTINLKQGTQYRFLAAGDFDAKDVDLDIQNPQGKSVKQDVHTNAEAVVDFSPPTSGRYLIRVRLYGSRNNLPCYCVAVALRK